MKALLTLTLYLLTVQFTLAQNYEPGDTLFVVAQNGLKLRNEPNDNSRVLQILSVGDSVEILSISGTPVDTIFDFAGRWVKVSTITDNSEGYVFDAFISQFPYIIEYPSLDAYKQEIEGHRQWDGMYDFVPSMLQDYALRTFDDVDCQFNYRNASDGEGYHSMLISVLNDEVKLIEHNYWEGGAIELELKHARISEIYYLILNILRALPEEWYQVSDYWLRNPQYKRWGHCGVIGNDQECLVKVQNKGDDTFSVFFYFPCC